MDIDNIKQYFWYLLGIFGIVFFWAGIWDGVGNLWYLKNPLVSLGVGILLLALSKVIFPDNVPFMGEKKPAHKIIKMIHQHPEKSQFHIKYHDALQGKELLLNAENLYKIEKDHIVFLKKEGGELFIPLHRVKEVLHLGKTHWRDSSSA